MYISEKCTREMRIEVYDDQNIGPQIEVPINCMKYYLINYKTKIKKLYHFFLSEKIYYIDALQHYVDVVVRTHQEGAKGKSIPYLTNNSIESSKKWNYFSKDIIYFDYLQYNGTISTIFLKHPEGRREVNRIMEESLKLKGRPRYDKLFRL